MLGCCAAVVAAQAQPSEFKLFWEAPSLQAFMSLGDSLDLAMGPDGMRVEEETRTLHRKVLPPFEAVKKRLAEGIVVHGPVSSRTLYVDGLPDPLKKNITRAQLPSIRPSFFGSDEPYVVPLRPFTLAHQFVEFADALSAVHKVPVRMKVLGPAKMGPHGVLGVWDVGTVGISFDTPVRVHGVAANGAATGADITSFRADFTTLCGQPGLNTINARGINPGWRGAILAWIGTSPEGTAHIATQQINGATQYDKLVIDTIDVDRDGVPDFSVWSGIEEAVASTDTFWKGVFVNMAGKWELLAFAQEADCT